MIEKAYQNSFALFEKLEMLKSDFRYFQGEVEKAAEAQSQKMLKEQRQALDTAQMQQIHFMQEIKDEQKRHFDKNRQNLQLVETRMQTYISKQQFSKVESAPSSPRQRFLEVRQRRSRPASKGSVADTEQHQLKVKQFLSTQPYFDKVKSPSSGDQSGLKSTALLKNQQLCLFEVCKLQNVLNRYICHLLPEKTERATATGETHEVDHSKIMKLIDQFLSIFPGAKEHSERVMVFQSNMTNKSN